MSFSQRILPVLFVIVSFVGASAALANPGDIEWRPVTPEELAMKAPKVEPDADAEAIFWEVRIDDSSDDLSMQHYVRVKIFTNRGREKYGKFDIPFTRGMKIKDIAARVIKPDGSAIEIGKQDIVEREIIKAGGVKVKAKSFAIPSLEAGSIVEYRYREVISDAGAAGMHLKFQRDIPVQTLSYFYKPYNKRAPRYQTYNLKDIKFVEDQKGYWVATRENIPALIEEPQMPPDDQVIPWVLLQSVGLNFSFGGFNLYFTIKDPSIPTLYWASVATDKSILTKFMNKPDKEIKRTAAEITTAVQTDEEKLKKLYEFCHTQINNTTYDISLTDDQRKKLPKNDSVADVLKHKSGSARYIDLLFGAMANSLGYETRIAFSSDRSEIFFKTNMTNEFFLHPASIGVKVGEAWKFFDPGLKFLPYGMLVWYEEDVWSLLVGETGFSWAKVPISEPEKSLARRTGKFKLLEDGTIEGDVKIEYTGQPALIYRLENYDDSEHQREENLKQDVKRRLSTAEISNIVIENLLDGNKPLVQFFKIRVPQYAQKTGKRLFLQPSFFEAGEPARFSSATRKYDIYFHYPWSQDDHIEFDLPAGYVLDSPDKPAPFAAENVSQYNIAIGLTTDKHTLVVHREFLFGRGGNILFPPTTYDRLKAFFDKLHKNEEHAITLKQAAAN
ncbi:MAG TPA: DUF3857 and transglutaminase domain-containing protein [Pyrinomonadaceae bacterium]|jgi:hypothetical protein|nr:DUF3857 and transglutaminase domain-containing protein [Pyrinomonadaceae bacterium]